MHRILVEEKRWVSEERFLHALNYCMLLPGPEAQQLATYIGWLLHGWRGGLVAGLLFVLPGFLSILALSILFAGFQGQPLVAAVFFGLKPVVVAIVAEAVARIGKRALGSRALWGVAGAAFVAIFFLDVPFPWIVVAAALFGFVGGRFLPQAFPDAGVEGAPSASPRPSLMRAVRVGLLWLTIWWLPIVVLIAWLGRTHIQAQLGVFFGQAAVVTFGGAYAVLGYVAQQAVDTFGWLQPGEMLDGLGMAETTPGPLIQVVQFVGFMAAHRNPGGLHPMLAGVLGSLVVTWTTFAPCFLWIFLGAPYVEALRGNRSLSRALKAITAAVVGVVLNLAVWFSLHTLFGVVTERRALGLRLHAPDPSTLDVGAALITIAAFVALFRFKLGMLPTLFGGIALGVLWTWLVG